MQDDNARKHALNLAERATQMRVRGRVRRMPVSASVRAKASWWTKDFFESKRARLAQYLACYDCTVDQLSNLLDDDRLDASKLGKAWRALWVERYRYDQFPLKDLQRVSFGWEPLCAPALASALSRIAKTIDQLNGRGLNADKSQIVADADAFLRRRLSSFMTPAFVLEANLARLTGTDGSNAPEARFRAFVDRCAVPAHRAHFWRKYPVLWRIVSSIVQNTADACIETLRRIAKDRACLEATFNISPGAVLRGINWGSGDAHSKGRVVALLHFESGSLVYKPKDLRADKAYQDFIAWYSSICSGPKLPFCTVLARNGYGYRSFVKSLPCDSRADVQDFYTRLGSLLAIAWLLGITDLHHENIVASGANPYLIDVEVMFSRPTRRRSRRTPSYHDAYLEAFQNTLLGTGLLPFRMLGPNGVYDVSAIGARGEQPAPAKVMIVQNAGRDDLELTPQHIPLRQELNVPVLRGIAQKSSSYARDIITGFTRAVDALDRHKSVLRDKGGPMKSFRSAPVRYVARSTMEYVTLLQKLAHPTILQDALDGDMLVGGELTTNGARHLERVIRHECEDLWQGDIPYFYAVPEDKCLYSSKGTRVDEFFEQTGFDAFQERLDMLGPYKGRHISVIRSSLNSTRSVARRGHRSSKINKDVLNCSHTDLLSLALGIGDDLLARAFHIDGLPFWVGYTPLEKADYNVGIVPPTLYGGAPGIGLFLAYLHKYTHEPRFGQAAERSRKVIEAYIKSASDTGAQNCGAFNGLAGLIYADLHIASALGCASMTEQLQLFRELKSRVKADENYDLVSGAAGALLVALTWHQRTADADALDVALLAAEKLYSSAEPQPTGVAWHTLKSETTPVGGLAHGVSGIAWALSALARHTGESKWNTLARRAFAYEQALYDEKSGQWHDARGGSPTCFWCYGASGIGVAAHHMGRTLGSKARNRVVTIAQEITWKTGLLANHCLCHGNLGNSDLYLLTKDHVRADALLSDVLRDFQSTGRWNCGLPGQDTTVGLMCGLAGIGYGLLRHADPKNVPSILSLQLPRGTSQRVSISS